MNAREIWAKSSFFSRTAWRYWGCRQATWQQNNRFVLDDGLVMGVLRGGTIKISG